MKRLMIMAVAMAMMCLAMAGRVLAADGDRTYYVAYGEFSGDPMSTPENQQKMAGHIAYMGELYDQGILVMGGPFTDAESGMLVLKADSFEAAKAIMAKDPAFGGGLIKAVWFHPWFAAFSRPDNHKFTMEEMASMGGGEGSAPGDHAGAPATGSEGSGEGMMEMTPGAVSFIQIPTTDAAVSAKFYTDVFGWESMNEDAGGMALTFFTAPGGMMGEFSTMTKPAAPMTGPTFFINTDSVKATLPRVTAAGGQVYQAEMALPEGWGHIAIIGDTSGNAVGLWSAGE